MMCETDHGELACCVAEISNFDFDGLSHAGIGDGQSNRRYFDKGAWHELSGKE